MNGDIVKEIDDYIAAQYRTAYEQNRGSKALRYLQCSCFKVHLINDFYILDSTRPHISISQLHYDRFHQIHNMLLKPVQL